MRDVDRQPEDVAGPLGDRAPGEPATGAQRQRLLKTHHHVQRDVRDLRPRDMIDIQSFIWVQGSDEYEE